MNQARRLASVVLAAALPLAACSTPSYSPNTYAGNAVQLANKVEAGTIVGFREVRISANGTVGTVVGGAAGGLLGAQYGESGLAALGGSTVGAMVGNTLEHVASDTTGWEYIIRKSNSDMLSVTQREKQPLPLGQKVLVIMGPQARVVPDYAVAEDKPPAPPAPKEKAEAPKPETPVKVEVVLSLPPGLTAQTGAASAAPPAVQAASAPSAQGPTDPAQASATQVIAPQIAAPQSIATQVPPPEGVVVPVALQVSAPAGPPQQTAAEEPAQPALSAPLQAGEVTASTADKPSGDDVGH